MDESCKQMIGEVAIQFLANPVSRRIDDEYVRNGVAEIFMEVGLSPANDMLRH